MLQFNIQFRREKKMAIERFKIDFPQQQLDDLYARLEKTRWPIQPKGTGWERGTEMETLQRLLDYWLKEFDWRKQEAALNRFSHYRCNIEGVNIHFIREPGKGANPMPLILTHGWPDSFVRYQKVISMLADPGSHGGDPNDAFEVIVPSVPGFGLSGSPEKPGINNSTVAGLWHRLMTEALGFARFGAGGGDVGSSVTRYLASLHPEALAGIHLTDVGIIRILLSQQDASTLTEEEQRYGKSVQAWLNTEAAYISMQGTKPWTLAYALNDSPAGLAAWIVEKFMSWSDCKGDLLGYFGADELLTNIMLYWLTETSGSSANIYYDNLHSLPPLGDISVPTGVALFSADVLPPPKSWVEKHFNLVQWTEISGGGHFTAMEKPEQFVEDIRQFFRPLR